MYMLLVSNVLFVCFRRHDMPQRHVPLPRGQVHPLAVGVQLPERLRQGRGRVPVLP